MTSSVKEFVNLAITIAQHFTKPNAPPMKAPQRFQTLLSGLSQKSIDEIQNAIPALSGLAELAFKPDFNPSSTVINDIILPSLIGYTDTLKSLIQQLIQTLKKFGEIFSSSNKDSKSSDSINGLSALTYQPNLCEEQIEEEGGNEEIESQLINKRYQWDVKNRALEAKREILNFYNDRNNPKPW
ncbi:MAG: hypothetical protein EZS28_005211 [Streblomastix strix]|uniref:Uncharacterized protein n=1 Tax=Streblomastix strix TaxID=222440 RepID=A0A5J4WWH1_9EUKA|nr:MAG: hypothetical protein EZS28_005211 [Streblomastix strix]